VTSRRLILTALAAAAALSVPTIATSRPSQPKPSPSYTLELIGVGWTRPEVVYAIRASRGVTVEAVGDVRAAAGQWAAVLPSKGGPSLREANSGEPADIEIHMKVGGGQVLGSTQPKTVSPFNCALQSVSIQLSGKVFGQRFSSTGTQNVALHELGHAFGLGHTDDPNDLMYAYGDPVNGASQSISSCDLKGIEEIYDHVATCDIPRSIACQ
jgi:hypothetical protein